MNLFRGDKRYGEALKQLIIFLMLAEAEYWIRQELKVKIRLDSSDPVVKTIWESIG